MSPQPPAGRGAGTAQGAGAPQDDPLGAEWGVGPDGLRFRRAARVMLLDADDRVLLLRGHDVDQPERSWWFTVGGGLEPGEQLRAAAVREVAEETGLQVRPEALVGPVLTRSAVFHFFRQHCRQEEVFFLARMPGDVQLSRAGWTAIEHASVDEVRWWTLPELERTAEAVYPLGLAALVRPLLGGWDGVTRHLGEAEEKTSPSVAHSDEM